MHCLEERQARSLSAGFRTAACRRATKGTGPIMAKSKFFRVFVEGFTVSDGRKIEAAWIDDIVATFNTANYTPRINVEHIKGYSPEPPFNGYGDVVAVKAQTD